MKKIIAIFLNTMIVLSVIAIAFADPTQTLDDIVNGGNQTTTSQDNTNQNGTNQNGANQNGEVTLPSNGGNPVVTDTPSTSGGTTSGETNGNTNKGSHDFINGNNGLIYAPDVTDVDTSGAEIIVNGARTIAGYIVVILSYIIVTFMVVRIMLDLTFITLPFTRTFLANGYSGNAQSSGQGMQNMAGGMPGMNGMGGYGGGFGGGYGGRYGGGYGGAMGGFGAQNQMMNNLSGQNAMMNRNSSMVGNIQFVSNAALNAVATESAIGPDGKTQSPYKIYFKDMTITLVCVPILIVLASTGVLAQFGFAIGNVITSLIVKAGSML